jgi:FkbM family methyltransferase
MSPLLQQLAQVEKLAKSTRFYRMFRHPLKYTFAICFNYGIYPILKKGFKLQTSTFFGVPITVSLPAGTDIFLTGGKSHSSEIRLAKFLILNLRPGDSFVDVGAHFGYFSLLAARLVGTSGQVVALEASKKTFDILEQNTRAFGQIKSNHLAAAAQQGQLEFYEFPDLYSEYNSTEITQFEQESWIAKYKPEKIVVPAIPIDSLIESGCLTPNVIKIDVEGAEFHVLQGMKTFLASDNSCSIVMEYLSAERGNEAHQKARDFMRSLGYETFVFGPEGHLVPVVDIDQYLTESGSDSDNVIFKKLR